MILNLNEMNGLLEKNLERVRAVRRSYGATRVELLGKAKVIIRKKKVRMVVA